MSIKTEYKTKIIRVLSALFPEATIYLFGSRAQGTHRPGSDVDIALDAGKKLNRFDVGEARNMLNNSNIPYQFDIVDLQNVSDEMKNIILREGIVWKQ